ncbi:cytochrome P450 [Roridomyces roridus]|uniref:Cytochrome P450 n=1 Tax=Roridomyces roridus TaxID=1738132 RepID=A0AAD7AYA6_9AGAR|nr:cytochrome P450 [Roridomyces roridus]
MTFLVLLSLGVLGATLLWLRVRSIGHREPGLPPGPPTIPLLGNLHVFPTEFAHYRFTEWARKYGGIFSLKIGPGTTVVLTDAAIFKELMDKRTASTADRPPLYIADLVTGGLNMSLARYSDTWRRLGRAAHTILTPDATAQHLAIQKAEATQLLYDFLTTPEDFYKNVQRYANSVILSVLYGQRSPRYESPETTVFFKANHEWKLVLDPGSTPPIELVPILKYVPAQWAKWKRDCKRTRELQRIVYFGLIDKTMERVQRGEENGCYMEEVLLRREEFRLDREMMGEDRTPLHPFLHSLILALMAYPEVQRKAHEEMDRIVGDQRMPTLDDLQRMPYIRAIILETHRFRPTAPLMLPHAASATEEYKGYIIPKGATIFVNASLYDDTEEFIPERYLDSENGTKPGVDGSDLRHNFVFGVGRRICPGMHLAQNSLNINTMNLIWAFNFTPPLDTTGNPIQPDLFAYMKGILTGPHPFACTITPRTTHKAQIVRREFVEAAETFARFEGGLSEADRVYVREMRAAAGSGLVDE